MILSDKKITSQKIPPKFPKLGILLFLLIVVFLIGFFYFRLQPEKVSGATIAFISDARPGQYPEGERLLTADLNQIDDQMPADWRLDAIVGVGDMDYISYPGGQNSNDAFQSSNINTLPVFYVLGNHELDNPYDLEAIKNKYASYPDWNKKTGPKNSEKTTYSFDIGEIHVAVLNEYFDGTNEAGTDGDIVDELFDWLKNDLRNTDREYKIVVGHEPAYPIERHSGNSLDKYETNRDRFWNLLQTERVMAYFCGHSHHSHLIEYEGAYEADSGLIGPHVGQGDNFATIIYAREDESNNFSIRMVQESEDQGWSLPKVTTKIRADLETQILVNTYEKAGTENRYWIDYDSTVEPNPDWSTNNNGKWWEDSFDDSKAGWENGELSTGYGSTDSKTWGWINQEINPDPNNSGQNHIYAIFQRVPFTVYNKNLYSSMTLGVDYNDALTIWVNGEKIFESDQSPTFSQADYADNFDLLATDGHNAEGGKSLAPSYTKYDKSDYLNILREGEDNLLVIVVWNDQVSSTDLAGAVKLYLEK